MNYHTVHFILPFLSALIFIFLPKKAKARLKDKFIFLWIALIFVPIFLPRNIYGEWNSISALKGKNITKIILSPSYPNEKINLVPSDVIITEKGKIDTLSRCLQNVNVYFPSHPSSVWKTKMTIITDKNDSLEINIVESDINQTLIYTPDNEWSKDVMGDYLEKITNYKNPVFADTGTYHEPGY